MPFKYTGKKTYVMVKNCSNGRAHPWPPAWQNCGLQLEVECHYCGKKFTVISDFRNGWACRMAGGKLVGRVTPVTLGDGNIRISPIDDPKHWDFVCRDCEPARKADWMSQQRGGKK